MADADTSRQRLTTLPAQSTSSHYCCRMERTSSIAQARVMVIPVLMSSFSPSNPDVAGCSPSLPSTKHGDQRLIRRANSMQLASALRMNRLTIRNGITSLIDTLIHGDTAPSGNRPAGVLIHLLCETPCGENNTVASVRKVAAHDLATTVGLRTEDEALADPGCGEREGGCVNLQSNKLD